MLTFVSPDHAERARGNASGPRASAVVMLLMSNLQALMLNDQNRPYISSTLRTSPLKRTMGLFCKAVSGTGSQLVLATLLMHANGV